MQTVTSTEIQNKFGEYLEKIRTEHVEITRSGRSAAVMISTEDYKRFQALDNAYWIKLAREAEKEPALAPGEAMARIIKRQAELDDAEA